MRYLIMSDLHANQEALDAVIREAEGRYDQAICCGDLVGYGADPNPVTEWVRSHCAVVGLFCGVLRRSPTVSL